MLSFKTISAKAFSLSLTSGGENVRNGTLDELYHVRNTLIQSGQFIYDHNTDTFITDLNGQDILHVIKQIKPIRGKMGKFYVNIHSKVIQVNEYTHLINYIETDARHALVKTMVPGIFTTVLTDAQIYTVLKKEQFALPNASFTNFSYTGIIHVD
jgi:DNA-binding cell septation regulator SpoVG